MIYNHLLCCAVLCCAVLHGAVLYYAMLFSAMLRCVTAVESCDEPVSAVLYCTMLRVDLCVPV